MKSSIRNQLTKTFNSKMLSGPLSLIELTKRAYLFAESYKENGIEGFSTGALTSEYNQFLTALEQFSFEDLGLDENQLQQIWEPNVMKISQVYGNKDLNIGLIFIPKGG